MKRHIVKNVQDSILNKCSYRKNNGGLLSGLKYTCKDNIVTGNLSGGILTTASSNVLKNYQSPFNAEVVKLLYDSGAELSGKVNLDEFGMGSSGLNSAPGPTLNPIYPGKIAGGSSSGSAASVAADLCDFSIGSDTGGSIRLPASYCNVIGFKPTYGRISRWGLIPYAQTLDTIGILSKKIDTIKHVYSVLNMYDEKDPTSLPEELRKETPETNKERLIIGIPEEFILEDISIDVKNTFKQFILKLINLGHVVKTISITSIKKALPTYYTLATAEAASNLSRYDGTRYGSTNDYDKLDQNIIFRNRSEFFGKEVKRRIILGNYTLSSSSGDHYLKSTLLRKQLAKEFSKNFNNKHVLFQDEQFQDKCDLLISPTAMSKAPDYETFEKRESENILNSYINDVLTVPASLVGLPTISIPINGIGIQIMGQFGDDKLVLHTAEDVINNF
ncbi:unnamed protein product [Candida verbasci]|uniref:Glutamyl-tRNA(Gln) amidotransferase subunit A, mitochondrial n=1 Tax=Candida verbasci TaxID=1227364 RepID=A0A9W4U025_9ASCO|nr:unnamed protein product [Candida verbasci]